MGITYNKEYKSKNRSIVTTGPRDHQRKQAMSPVMSDQSDLIIELREQIKELKSKINEQGSLFTSEQVNDEIIKSVKAETMSMQTKHEVDGIKRDLETDNLKSKIVRITAEHDKEISSLKDIVKTKEEMIEQINVNQDVVSDNKLTILLTEATKKIDDMTMQLYTYKNGDVPESDRPKMETVFVDPIEKETKVEQHFDAKSESATKKVNMNDKVNKLKSLVGKLPSKKI